MIEAIKKLIEGRDALAKEAVQIYEPIVQQYITTNCQDSNQICYTLDFMLDFCFDDEMLLLYRKLCRHLYSFDEESAAFYVDAYREMWDEDGEELMLMPE